MRSRTEDPESGPTPSATQLLTVIGEGRYGDTSAALARVTALLPHLETAADRELFLIGLWGRAELLRCAEAPAPDVAAVCGLLEQAARERVNPLWTAVACGLRAATRLDAGDVNASMADLARVDLDQLADGLSGPGGGQLLDLLAVAYDRLRLPDRADELRHRAEQSLATRPPVDRAIHWAHRATELATRALEPIATGSDEPDLRLLQQAARSADQLSTVPPDLVPDRLRRGADAVRALEAAYRGRPGEALRLLGEDGFRPPRDLPGLERRLAMIAGMHAQALIGAVDTARLMDDDTGAPPSALPHLVLDVCRAQERLHLETIEDGDRTAVIERLNGLLVRLGWAGMDLVAETARQALEHQALRVENRTDALTGVGNRRALDEELRSMLRFSPLPLSLVLVDVDDFKCVNDRFTHVVGDEVLRRVAASLSQQLRTGDRLVRYGGDEFVVLLPLASDTEAEAVASRMIEAVRVLPWRDVARGLQVRITTGCGTLWSLSHRRPDGDAEYLFRLADEQLLEAKQRRADDGPCPVEAGAAARPAAAATTATTAPAAATAPAAPAAEPGPGPRTEHLSAPDPTLPAPTPARRVAPPPAAAADPAEEVAALADVLDDPLAGNGRSTAASLQLPFSPAGGLPLYQALLRDPPRIDPHLGLLPPVGLTSFTRSDAFRQVPETEDHLEDDDVPAPAATAPDGESAGQPRNRPRRRPQIIDLTALEKRRSPFG